jgi:hypothetical protein
MLSIDFCLFSSASQLLGFSSESLQLCAWQTKLKSFTSCDCWVVRAGVADIGQLMFKLIFTNFYVKSKANKNGCEYF